MKIGGENEILHVAASKNERKLAFALGKQLIKDEQLVKEIVVYEYNEEVGDYEQIVSPITFDHTDACV